MLPVVDDKPFAKLLALIAREPKFVKSRLGGPSFSGLEDVPPIPSAPAIFPIFAKKGTMLLRLRLKLTFTLSRIVGEKL
jgi:hypothetical protein